MLCRTNGLGVLLVAWFFVLFNNMWLFCAYGLFGSNVFVYYCALCTTVTRLADEVVVTRKGQTTIPAGLRAKYRIVEGTRLEVVDAGSGILFRPVKSMVDLAGSGAGHARPEEMKRLLDRLRDEDV